MKKLCVSVKIKFVQLDIDRENQTLRMQNIMVSTKYNSIAKMKKGRVELSL